MAEFAPRFQAYCQRCEGIVRVPESLLLDDIRRIVVLRREGHTLQAIAALFGTDSIDRADAKRFVFHIANVPGHCHRCGKRLPVDMAETCPTCHCINLDFTEV